MNGHAESQPAIEPDLPIPTVADTMPIILAPPRLPLPRDGSAVRTFRRPPPPDIGVPFSGNGRVATQAGSSWTGSLPA